MLLINFTPIMELILSSTPWPYWWRRCLPPVRTLWDALNPTAASCPIRWTVNSSWIRQVTFKGHIYNFLIVLHMALNKSSSGCEVWVQCKWTDLLFLLFIYFFGKFTWLENISMSLTAAPPTEQTQKCSLN